MSKKITTFEKFPKVWERGMSRPIKNAKKYFDMLGTMLHKDTDLTFRQQGARAGLSPWRAFKTKTGIKRPGTDESETRRRTPSDQLLQASGGFKKSFKIFRSSQSGLIYGTNHKLRGKIGSNPERQVLNVTDSDIQRYQRLFSKFVDAEIKF